MNIVVCVKQVPDTNIITLDENTGSVDVEDLVHVINSYDMLAVNEAVQIKERNGDNQVTVVSMGPPSTKKILRRCLAIGADRAMLLWDDAFDNSDTYATAVILSRAISLVKYDLVLCGERAVDTEAGQVGATIAEMLDISLVSGVVKIDISPSGREAIAQRKLEKGNREVVNFVLPALLTVSAGLNEPRYASLPSLMQALRQDIEEYNLRALGLSPEEVGLRGSKTKTLKLSLPKPRPKKLFTPDSSLSAAERMRLVMTGGVTEKKGELIKDDPREVASKLVQFLSQERLLP